MSKELSIEVQSGIQANYKQFWNWFEAHNKQFLKAVKQSERIESDFFDVMMPKLALVHEGILFLTGMFDESSAELVFTADGVVKNIVFVEELVAAAPQIDHWIFTALKPEHDIEDVNIEISGLNFEEKNIQFYAKEHPQYPDEIDLEIVYNNFSEEYKEEVYNGTFIFLDHVLGEIKSVTLIDNINVSGTKPEGIDLIPISKLKGYLKWREKEFVERYNEAAYSSIENGYTSFEVRLENSFRLLAIMNTAALNWEGKTAFPWILKITFYYKGRKNDGFPEDAAYELMDQIEEAIVEALPEQEGYINIGRETGNDIRDLYIASSEFRQSSKVLYAIIKQFEGQMKMDYNIFKDKYWQTFERYHQL